MKEIFVVRHGVTEYNAKSILTGHKDIPILSRDESRIISFAQRLKKWDFDLILSSDLLRAKQTAKLFSKSINAPIIFDPRLREINYGSLQGMSKSEIKEKYPNFKEDINFEYPNGERISQAYIRAEECVNDYLKKYDKILIISHSGIIRGLFKIYNNLNYIEVMHRKIKHDELLRIWRSDLHSGAYFV